MRVAVPVRARPIAVLAAGGDRARRVWRAAASRICRARAPVTFESRDGVTLEGRLFGDGSTGVVLSHMRPADQRSWFAFANRLADEGYLVLTYDFRGYCPGGEGGCSQGELQISAIWQDVLGAMDFIRSQGATTVALVGASMGGTASLVAAGQEGADVAAVVTLSAPTSIEGLTPTPPCSSASRRASCSSPASATRRPRRRRRSSTRSPRRPSASRSCRPTTTAPTCLRARRARRSSV